MKEQREHHLRLYARTVSLLAVGIGLAVLLGGWLFGSELLIRLRPGLAGMVPSTAGSFVLLGLCILRCSGHTKFEAGTLVRTLALIVAIVALFDLAIILLGAANGIDAFFFPGSVSLGRLSMAPATALCLLLASGYLLLIDHGHRSGLGQLLLSILPTLGLILSGTALIGYLFDAEGLYSVSAFTAMALHTALGLFAVFSALLALRPQQTWVRHLLEDFGGSQNARRVVPVAIIVPIATSGAVLLGTHAGLISSNFGMALLAVIMVVLLTTTIVWSAAVENTADKRLIETIGQLNQTVADRDLLLREVYHRVKNNLQQINALLLLQGNRLQNPDLKHAFASTSRRIEAMASVHTLLVSRDNPSDISTRTFLTELSDKIAQSLAADARGISLDVQVDDAPIHIDRAVSLGLILNEILSNAFEHAYDGAQSGIVNVRFTVDAGRTSVLSVRDNGKGMPPEVERTAGTGLTIIDGLVKQLNGTLSIDTGSSGTDIAIRLPASTLSETSP